MGELELKSLEKEFSSGIKVVDGLDLKVEEGEFMVLVGPSGCAKSTTLRMIAGLETATRGEIRIGKQMVNHLVPGRRGVAMVFQNYALYPHMKVHKNLSFSMLLKRVAKPTIQDATQTVAGMLEIEQLLERLPKELSGGQAQRVALGRALIKQPEVFLFDEPLSNLDAKLRSSMRVRITDLHKRLRSEGRPATVVYVTHDQVEAMTMGDRICVMDKGRIMQVADPLTLYRQPANTFVAGFIGTPEMNLIKAELVQNDGLAIRVGDQQLALNDDVSSQFSAIPGPMTLGIRPQHLVPCDHDKAGSIRAELVSLEFMGHEFNLYARVDGEVLVACVPSEHINQAFSPGDRISLLPDLSQMHWFNALSGSSLRKDLN